CVSGQYLLWRNTHSTSGLGLATFQFFGGASNNSLTNCIIENNTTLASTGVILIGTGTNNNITISGNSIASPSGGTTNNPANGIYSNTATNTAITVASNSISNFATSGVLVSNGASWTIGGAANGDGNSFFQTTTATTTQTAISVGVGTGHTVKFNKIGGSAAGATGTWTNSGAVSVIGIAFSGTAEGTISNNAISNFSLTNTAASGFTGINQTSSGSVTIQTDTIGHASAANSILYAGSGAMIGINTSSVAANTINQNILANLSATGTTTTTTVRGIATASTGACTITQNTVRDITTATTAIASGASGINSKLIGIFLNSSSTASSISKNSVYAFNHR
ncbi:MAG: hypothetical protein IPP77_01910, partial [Bacteroidetes bacterium]|nr:hypothetical protein [Bacteroidota bacterium]